MAVARLIIADSERNADLYYATRFLAPDPFIFVQVDGRRLLVMSDLELDRAKSQSRADEVLSYAKLSRELKRKGTAEPAIMDVVADLLKSRQVKEIEVPVDFGVAYADALRKRGLTVQPKADPFFPERMVKSEEEVALLTEALRVTEDALATAIELIRNSDAKPDGTLWLAGKPLTVELLRKTMHLTMMERDCVAQHTIVAPGVQAVDPHNEGSGPLRANEPVVMDVFPQHARSRYFADITRTVVRGKASPKVKRMFEFVKAGQEIAFGMIKDGVDGSAVHRAIMESFERAGFKTGEQGGRMQGFFHGTGHGVGLEIHEPPRVSGRPDILKAGMVVTVEPGLYYLDAGGMRIEDMVVVRPNGCEVLTKAPKVLEI
ncbi:MAG: Xaa-Pro aminopeptidase [Omnitrophica WOR_2 bacterium RIFCSPHIGHO2_02_FULL_67_20]|nr:MAG: Xaa-Pro aminopeptidase [Omnitrophica WOR_2 bacterium RIFCSPHIGHO2_02_FULL_67_20]